jgi:uncharacterized protein YjbJ (UPF0337 family)
MLANQPRGVCMLRSLLMSSPFDPLASATPAASPPETTAEHTPAEAARARWPQLIAAARLRWGKLTEADLLKTAGNEHQLAVLVQGRYDIPRGDAYRQVRSFHEAQKP